MSKLFVIFLLTALCEKSVFSSNLGISAIRDRLLQFNLSSVKLECVLRIVQQEVECQDYFTVLHQSQYGDQIIEHLSATNCYSFITRTPKPQKWLLRSEAYIILVENVNDFIGSIDKLSKDFAWNAVARFFIVIRQFENMQHLYLFKVLAKFNIYHVHVITSKTIDKTLIYTYNPFENNRCGRVDKNIIKIDDCKGFIHNELNENEMEDLLRPCPIAVIARENPPNVIFKTNKKFRHGGAALTGIEQYMLSNIAEKEKFKFNYISVVTRKYYYKNITEDCATSKSLLQYLPKYPLGISIGGYQSTKKSSDCYDFMWGYCYGNIIVYTAVSDEEEWRKLIQEFGTTTWGLIALSYSSVTVFLLIIYKFSTGKINKKYIILRIWGYLHNTPDKELIKIRKLRVLLLTWIWFSFFIVNFYNTALYTLITAPDKRGIIIKPEKLFSSPLKPCISNKFRQWFKLAYNVTLPTTREGECFYDDTALDAVTKNKDLYTLVSEPTHYRRDYKYLDKFGHPKLDRWLFGTGDFLYIIISNRGFPLLNKFQRYAWYHFESGLLLKHTEDIFHKINIFTEFTPFALSDLKVPFTVLFVGYVISFIVYVIEINHIH